MSELVTKPIPGAELMGFAKGSTHPTTSTYYDEHQRNARPAFIAPSAARPICKAAAFDGATAKQKFFDRVPDMLTRYVRGRT
jgi:hypothetical protein